MKLWMPGLLAPESSESSETSESVGDREVQRLARDCLSAMGDGRGLLGLGDSLGTGQEDTLGGSRSRPLSAQAARGIPGEAQNWGPSAWGDCRGHLWVGEGLHMLPRMLLAACSAGALELSSRASRGDWGRLGGPVGMGVNGREPSGPTALGDELFLRAALMMFLASRACICRLARGSASCRSGDRDLSLHAGDMGGPSSSSGTEAGLAQPSRLPRRRDSRGVQVGDAGRDDRLSWRGTESRLALAPSRVTERTEQRDRGRTGVRRSSCWLSPAGTGGMKPCALHPLQGLPKNALAPAPVKEVGAG